VHHVARDQDDRAGTGYRGLRRTFKSRPKALSGSAPSGLTMVACSGERLAFLPIRLRLHEYVS
jgi:hypothetical protein